MTSDSTFASAGEAVWRVRLRLPARQEGPEGLEDYADGEAAGTRKGGHKTPPLSIELQL